MKTLIAYFSRADENYVAGEIKNLTVGNTEVAAGILQKLTEADMFKIEPLKPYPADYNDCINKAQTEQRRNERPALKTLPESLDGYDTVYLGYPNYWGTMPMPVFTFLEHFDFAGKDIYPFCTHEGSGMGKSVSDIESLCPGANLKPGLAIRGRAAADSEETIKKWINN